MSILRCRIQQKEKPVKVKHCLTAFSLLILSGCSLEPPYVPPPTQIPTEWQTAQDESVPSAPSQERWWRVFNDPILNSLEERALCNNRDLYSAFQKVLKARANVGIYGARLYPHLTGSIGYSREKFLFEFFAPPGIPVVPSYRIDAITYNLPFTLFYEVDLWGKLRCAQKAAFCDYLAEQAAYAGSLLILSSELAVNYFQLRSLDSQIDLLKEIIDVRKASIEVVKERFSMGLTNYADVSRAETLLYNAEYDLLSFTSKRELSQNTIATLIGVPPSYLSISHRPLDGRPPQIPAGIPSDILLNRPDIREAERQLAEQNALVGEAYASFFPSLSLTGIYGFLSQEFKQFLTLASGVTGMTATLSQPIFEGFRLESNLQLSWARFGVASGHYQQTVLVAFREVEDALTKLKYVEEEIDKIQRSVEAAQITTEISKTRYADGMTLFLEVADSQRAELTTSSQLINLFEEQYAATIHLIKALGGVWKTECNRE